ncbi:hypothetical protein EC396_11440 [Lutibacter sp. HS1-25]|uniref:hypothetical protein n=1 Tax=Lutibacter sp. HS1-25 TaxID=2485000 RepID=UPI00101218E3|nr:hypothetical protein [Lutibacter sp. HS1-25]RXP52261.1 hypothetical protein EC396_11440 [Lutibacter sp. HS1-25]
MKHFIALFLISFLIVGCNNDDDYNDHDYHLEYTSVISADVPSEFIYGRTYRINVTIELPSSCYYYYNQYDYFYEGNARLIYPIVHVDDGVPCAQNIREITFSIPVQALQYAPYVFKFYQGEDADGQDKFLTIEVPVI